MSELGGARRQRQRVGAVFALHLGGGVLAAALSGALILWRDVGGLARLIATSDVPVLATAMFFFALAAGCTALAVAVAVSSLGAAAAPAATPQRRPDWRNRATRAGVVIPDDLQPKRRHRPPTPGDERHVRDV